MADTYDVKVEIEALHRRIDYLVDKVQRLEMQICNDTRHAQYGDPMVGY